MRFRAMLAAGCLALSFGSPATAGEVHTLDGLVFEAPDRWAQFAGIEGQELGFIRPDSLGRLSVYWWLPDEPLLGAPDILSHETLTVAGRPALLIHYDFYSEESLKAVLLEPRSDGRQLVIAIDFPRGETATHDALLRQVLESVRLGVDAASPGEAGREDVPPAGGSGGPVAPDGGSTAVHAWLSARFGPDCSMVELEEWRHPVRDVLQQAGANRLLWLALCQDRTYPVFGMAFDYDPAGATRDYFLPLWQDMLDANGGWAFSVAVLGDQILINVAQDAGGIVVDEEALEATPPDPATAAPGSGTGTEPGIAFTDDLPARDDAGSSLSLPGPLPGGNGGSALSGADPENLPPVSGTPDPGASPRNGMEAVMRDLNDYLKD